MKRKLEDFITDIIGLIIAFIILIGITAVYLTVPVLIILALLKYINS